MGREMNWNAEENNHLAQAWLAACEYPIVRTDHTRDIFKESVRCDSFHMALTHSSVRECRYGSRSIVIIYQHFSELSAEVKKFWVVFGKTKASGPTGVSDCEVRIVAIAIKCGKTSDILYNYKDIDCAEAWSS